MTKKSALDQAIAEAEEAAEADRNEKIEEVAEKKLINLEADKIARSQFAASDWVAPEASGSLAEQLLMDDPEVEFFVEGMAPQAANIMLIAQWKAGKTTLGFNLAKCAVDGVKFLDSFKVNLEPGTSVAYFNFEVGQVQARKWLRDMDIDHPEQIYVQHMQGVGFHLPNQVAEDWAVEYLKSRNTSMWVVDPLGAAYTGEENSNSEVRDWLAALDRIKKRAGVSVLIVVVHTGSSHGEGFKARGATRQMDWADVLWTYRHGGEGVDIPPDSKRYLRAYGRDVDLPELTLDFDPARRWMFVEEGGLSRSENGVSVLANKAESVVKAHFESEGNPINTTSLKEEMGCGAKGRASVNATKAIEYAVKMEWIKVEPKGNSKLYSPGQKSGSWSIVNKSGMGSDNPTDE